MFEWISWVIWNMAHPHDWWYLVDLVLFGIGGTVGIVALDGTDD